MMKKILFPVLVFALMFYGCDKTLNENTNEPKKFSKLSPEEHKAEIQNSAINLVNELEEFSTSKGVKASVNGVDLFSTSEELESAKSTPVNILYQIDALSKKKIDAPEFLVNLSKLKSTSEDPENIQEMYDSIKGTYTYNFETEEFDKTSSSNLVVEFPSTEDGTTNDATFEVIEFQTDEINTSLLGEEELVTVPILVKCTLTIGSAEAIEYNLEASFYDDGIPKKISTSLTISGYTFSATFINNNYSSISAEYKFSHGSKQLIAFKAGVSGDFNESNIEDNTHYYIQTCESNEITGEYTCIDEEVTASDEYDYEEVDVENILHSSYAFIEIIDVRIGGEVNTKALIPVMDKIDEDEDAAMEAYWGSENEGDFNEKPYEERRAKAMNDNLHFFAAYIEDNHKIADVEFYVKEDQDSSFTQECDENWNCGLIFEGMDTYYYVDGRMKFGDDSKIDAETYFKNGFSKFFDEMNEMITTLNNEYDADLDEVNYDSLFIDDEY